MTTGDELRNARERCGLSLEQISAATKIPVRKIAALEEDAFERLPRGIYLDGIAAAFAREVGIDSDAFIRRLRDQVGVPPPVTLEEVAAVRESHDPHAPELHLSPVHGMVAYGAVVTVLAVLGVVVQFYPLQLGVQPEQRVAAVKTDRIAPPVAQDIPDILPAETATTGFAPVGDPAEPPAAAEPTPVHAPEASPQPVAPPTDFAASSDVAGTWTLETVVESSSVTMFEGLRLGYRLELRQKDGRIEGVGRKISENGVSLGGGRRTPIAVQGTIEDGRLMLTFGEQGARRRSTGTFDLVLEDPGVLRGSFSSNAARSAGVVEARRL